MSSVVKVDKSQKEMPVHYTLRFKFAVGLTLMVAALLLANAALITYTRINDLGSEIEQHGLTFAQLTYAALGDAYQRYPANEAFKFRDEMVSYIHKDLDVEEVMVLDLQGKVLFDSADENIDSKFKSPDGSGVMVSDETLGMLRRMDQSKQWEQKTQFLKNRRGDRVMEILNPYIDASGNVPYVLRYVISYQTLRTQVMSSVFQMGWLTLIGMLISVVVALLFARRITQPINILTLGTSAIAQGNFDHKLNIHTNDELEDLARNFNFMAENLKLNINKLEESKAKVQESNLRLEQSNARLATTNKQLEKANEELKELDRLKSEFLQTISHELRTPLSAIKGYNEYLLEQMIGPISAGQERALRIIQRNIERLTTYINALLDFSRIESGTIPVTIHAFNLANLIEQTLLTYKTQIEKKELILFVEIDDELPLVSGDRDRIGQVIDNLVSNAIKFTSEGGSITLSAHKVTKNDHTTIEFSIADTGVGINEKSLHKIFDRFYQADSSTTRKYGGIGLGLSLVKKILESHKSHIHVQSREGEGTKFSFELEIGEKVEAIELDSQLALVENKKSYLIELIDDEPDINEMLKIALIKEGYNVIDASTGESGLQIARVHHPDLIILDVKLPDINGFEVLTRLKQESHTRNIPVMIMSILNDTKESIEHGAVDHLTKPVDFKQLKSKINQYLQQSNRAAKMDRPTVMIVDDEADVIHLLCDRLAVEGFNTLAVSNGNVALDLIKNGRVSPAIMLLDVMMPEKSGWEVIKTLKGEPNTAQIPVILVSAKGAEEDIKRGYELGALDYIVKPFEIKELLAEIKNVVREQANYVL